MQTVLPHLERGQRVDAATVRAEMESAFAQRQRRRLLRESDRSGQAHERRGEKTRKK